MKCIHFVLFKRQQQQCTINAIRDLMDGDIRKFTWVKIFLFFKFITL